jgi:meso-butanediol dehydrogenase/(S,S)-butanediol dehydrogenase/diacetyl reductase
MSLLAEKVAIVTGGGRGIGRGIVLALARAGADVAITDVDLETASLSAKEVTALGRRALVARVDVTDAQSAKAGVDETLAQFGKIDILVNNAGVVQDHIGDAVTGYDFERCFQVNLMGIWNVSNAVIPHFRERGAGKIANIASIAGRRGDNGLAPYSASKAGAISLTQSLAAALGPRNINVNAVCPGLLWTPMWEKLEGMFRGTTADDVVGERAAVSEAARNITGQALNVDGGIQMN